MTVKELFDFVTDLSITDDNVDDYLEKAQEIASQRTLEETTAQEKIDEEVELCFTERNPLLCPRGIDSQNIYMHHACDKQFFSRICHKTGHLYSKSPANMYFVDSWLENAVFLPPIGL